MNDLEDHRNEQIVDFFLSLRSKFKKRIISNAKSHDFDCWILSFLFVRKTITLQGLISYLSFFLDASSTDIESRVKLLDAQGLINVKSKNLSLSEEAERLMQIVNANELKEKRRLYEELTRLMDTYGAIFVIGAGFSFNSAVPLEKELMPLVLSSLEVAGIGNPKKRYLKSSSACWSDIKNHATALMHFKKSFAEMVAQKIPDSAHRGLIRLFNFE